MLPTCKAAAFAFGAVCKARWKVSRRITARASKSSTDWKLWIACLAALPGSLPIWIWFECHWHVVAVGPEFFLHVLHIFCTLDASTCFAQLNVGISTLFFCPMPDTQQSGAINVPQASICRSLHLPQNSFTWSALVAILSPAGLFGAWLAPLAVSPFGNLWLSILVKSRVLITAFSPRIALLINAQERVLPEEPRVCKSHHRSGMITGFFND